MTPREIQTLMRQLFYGDIPMSDGYRHLMRDGELARDLVEGLIDDYVFGDEVLVYLHAHECASCPKKDAYEYIKRIYSSGRLRLASPDFSGRILIESIGVGVGYNKSFNPDALKRAV